MSNVGFDFEPGFRIELHQKDLNPALSGARALGIGLPNIATCQELFNAAAAAGGKAWDHSAMVRVLEARLPRDRREVGRGGKGSLSTHVTPLVPPLRVDRAVLVTGAASGIGAAFARSVAGPGVGLVLHGGGSTPGSEQRLLAVRDACVAAGAACLLTRGDLSTRGPAASSVEAGVAAFGRLDHVVHAAGHVHKGAFGDLTRDGLDHTIALMAGAFFELATAAFPHLVASGAGRVVAVSSFIAHKLEPASFAPASVAAKAALEALVRCLAFQLAPTGMTVNAVVPGYTQKDAGKLGALSTDAWNAAAARTPTGRLGQADEVAAAIRFLLSAEARQITGAMLAVDGGLTLG